MFPTTGKRKAEESNPLLNAAAAKRAKKGPSTKRKGMFLPEYVNHSKLIMERDSEP